MTDDKLVPTGTFTDDHDVTRCVWCRSTSAYQHYHDHEWGFPVNDDRRLFEKVCLEGFQAGLSWLTILNKREAFRLAFAQRAQALRSEFGSLAAYFRQFEPQPTTRPERLTYQSLSGLTTSAESIALSKDLRKRGWSFVGPTTMYAFMQAMGLVNDHLEGCTARQRALQARTDFSSPARDSNA